MTTGLEKRPDAEGEGKQDRPRLVSVKRTTGTERQRASLFEREARVCDVNSEVQGASSEAAAALIFWFFCIKTKELYKEKRYLCKKVKIMATLNQYIVNILPQIQRYLSEQPVRCAWLFGSYSRGEETPDSDVDILVRYDDTNKISLFTISRIMCSLSKILNRKVDLVEEDALLPFAASSALQDRILIYERKD